MGGKGKGITGVPQACREEHQTKIIQKFEIQNLQSLMFIVSDYCLPHTNIGRYEYMLRNAGSQMQIAQKEMLARMISFIMTGPLRVDHVHQGRYR